MKLIFMILDTETILIKKIMAELNQWIGPTRPGS